MSDKRQTDRRDVLKSGLALGGIAATAGIPFWSKLALAQGEELVRFTDMLEDYSAPPVTPGGIHFLDTRHIDSFYTSNDDFYIIQHYLLGDAGVQDAGIEVVFYGSDKGTENIRNVDVEQAFGRSMHIDDAQRADVMIAYEMNGVPLPHYHGAPVRLIVPGWYGIANVKWLEHIHVQDRRYMARFMARDYVTLSKIDVGGVERWDESSVTRIQLKSTIIRVTRGDGSHRITGFVLNDGTPLESIEIKIDDGPWRSARIDPESTQYSWKLFNFDWRDATPGEHSLVSRVTDVNGQVQATVDQMPEKRSRWENYAQFTRTVMIS